MTSSPSATSALSMPAAGSNKRRRSSSPSSPSPRAATNKTSSHPPPPPPPPPPSGIYLAPMVRGSELAMRMLARSRNGGGASLCYGPMLRDYEVIQVCDMYKNSANIDNDNSSADNDGILDKIEVKMDAAGRTMNAVDETAYLLLRDTCPADTANLVVQLCGSNPKILATATKSILELYSTIHGALPAGIDLNLGCPQECASKGNFGAFLVERNEDVAIDCIKGMRGAIDDYSTRSFGDVKQEMNVHRTRLSAKMRLFDQTSQTIAFAKRLQDAGCDHIAVHCRRRTDKHDGLADWDAGTKIVAALNDLPIVLNGGITTAEEANKVVKLTNCHAVMVAQGYLQNHHLLVASSDGCCTSSGADNPTSSLPQLQQSKSAADLAAEYLDFAEKYPPPCYLYIQKHLRYIFCSDLQPATADPTKIDYTDWRPRLWGFLVRPYLRTIEQSRLVVALYVKLSRSNNDNEPPVPRSVQHLVEDVTFKSIRKAAAAKGKATA